jgi:hypothetical protein
MSRKRRPYYRVDNFRKRELQTAMRALEHLCGVIVTEEEIDAVFLQHRRRWIGRPSGGISICPLMSGGD